MVELSRSIAPFYLLRFISLIRGHNVSRYREGRNWATLAASLLIYLSSSLVTPEMQILNQ